METQRRAQWLRGVLDLCVLGALADGESYGYEIAQRLEVGGLGQVAGGTLYPALLRLERDGQVSADWRPSAAGPARKYYRLTGPGTATVQAAAAEWADFAGKVTGLLGKVATP